MLIIPVIGWFLVAQPQLAAASSADQQRADMQAQNAATALIVQNLKADSVNLPKLNDELDKLRTSIPAGVDSSGYIDGLDALAQLSHVTISSLTVESPAPYVAATPPVVAAPAAEDGEDAAAQPPAADPAIVTSPLIDATNFITIPVTLSVTGDWSSVLYFVDGLQSSPRLFLVTALGTAVIDDASGGSQVRGSITGFIYAIPTGVEGHPHPISTTVKSMVAAAPPTDDTAGTDDGSTDDGSDEPDTGDTDTTTP
jgi:Tfp pilus assembly protein PilO